MATDIPVNHNWTDYRENQHYLITSIQRAQLPRR